MSDIAVVIIRATNPLFADDCNSNRLTSPIILVDEAKNATVAVGMVH